MTTFRGLTQFRSGLSQFRPAQGVMAPGHLEAPRDVG